MNGGCARFCARRFGTKKGRDIHYGMSHNSILAQEKEGTKYG